MKKLWLLIIVCLLVGCNSGVDKVELTQKSNISPTEITTEYTLADHLTFGFTGATSASEYFENEAWTKYMKDKYKLDIRLDFNDVESDFILCLNYGEGYSSSNYFYTKYANKEYANDLTKYYERYDFSQYFDSSYLSFISDDDGIYAIPVVDNGIVYPRYYKSDILKEANMSTPKTADEFFKYLMVSKEQNNDNENYTPLYVPNHLLGEDLSDVFRAFGVYLGGSPIYYNPVTKSIEDAMFSDGIYEAGNYIQMLIDNNLLYVYGQSTVKTIDGSQKRLFNDEKVSSDIAIASERKFVLSNNGGYKKEAPDYDYNISYYLEGTNTKYLVEIEKKVAFYIFPHEISNLDGTIALFNKVMTDDAYLYDFKYGVEGVDYSISEGKVISKRPTYGDFVNLKLLDPQKNIDVDSVNQSYQLINTLQTDQSYDITTFHVLLGINSGFIYDIKQGLQPFDLLFKQGVSTVDAVEEYQRIFKMTNTIDRVNAMNERLGAITSYDYN